MLYVNRNKEKSSNIYGSIALSQRKTEKTDFNQIIENFEYKNGELPLNKKNLTTLK